MLKKTIILCMAALLMTACSSDQPRITNASSDLHEIRAMSGMATQIDAPAGRKIESAVIGDPSLADLDVVDNVLNIFPKDHAGDTNLIIRAADEDGEVKIYQYLLVVYKRH
jgi:hypothetical protein